MRMIARHAQQFSARPCGFKENAMLGLLLKMAENNVDPVIEKSQELNVTVNVNQSDQLEYDDVDEGKLIEVIREFWGRATPRFPRMTLTHAIVILKPSNSL